MVASSEFQDMLARFKDLFSYLSQNSGREVNTFLGVQYLNNTLFIEELYNRTLPLWTKEVYKSPRMSFATNLAFTLNTYTRPLARLKAGPLLKDILTRFETKFRKQLKPDRSLFIYSAHDTTVANLLNTLKLFQVSQQHSNLKGDAEVTLIVLCFHSCTVLRIRRV